MTVLRSREELHGAAVLRPPPMIKKIDTKLNFSDLAIGGS